MEGISKTAFSGNCQHRKIGSREKFFRLQQTSPHQEFAETENGFLKSPMKILFESPEGNLRNKLKNSLYLYPVGKEDDPYWHHGF